MLDGNAMARRQQVNIIRDLEYTKKQTHLAPLFVRHAYDETESSSFIRRVFGIRI
jgi:hypothetical protein